MAFDIKGLGGLGDLGKTLSANAASLQSAVKTGTNLASAASDAVNTVASAASDAVDTVGKISSGQENVDTGKPEPAQERQNPPSAAKPVKPPPPSQGGVEKGGANADANTKCNQWDDCGQELKNMDSKSVKMNKYSGTLYAIMALISMVLILVLLVFSIIDLFRVVLSRAKENKRLRNGETLLYKDSFDKKLLTDETFLLVYKDAKLMDGIFLIGILMCIFLTVNFLLTMLHTIVDRSASVGNRSYIMDGLSKYVYVIVTALIYYVAFYKISIQKNINTFVNDTIVKVDKITKDMLSKMSQDYTFYEYLKKEQTDDLKEYIKTMGDRNAKIKMLYTYNLYEYFSSYVPEFSSTPLYNAFSVESVRKGDVYLADYLKVGCNNAMKNLYHTLGMSESRQVEGELSRIIKETNVLLSKHSSNMHQIHPKMLKILILRMVILFIIVFVFMLIFYREDFIKALEWCAMILAKSTGWIIARIKRLFSIK
jgi:hypothetical protein